MQSRLHFIFILFTILLSVGIVACSSASPKMEAKDMELGRMSDQKKKDHLADIPGFAIYKKHCRLCHGMDGAKGVSGAKDLTASILNRQEREQLIRQGKGTMKSYQGILTVKEITEVSEFVSRLTSGVDGENKL